MKNNLSRKVKVLIVITMLLVLILPGCGRQSSPDTSATTPEEEEMIKPWEETEEENIISKTGMLEGLIIEVGTRLFAIDPSASPDSMHGGEIIAIRDFTPQDNTVTLCSDIGNNTFQSLQYYNQDLTKRLARKMVEDSEGNVFEHIGWVDTDGEFEDITARVEDVNDNSFTSTSKPLGMRRARNYRDLFLYADAVGDDATYRIPIDGYSPDKLETYKYGREVGYFSDGDSSHVDPTGVMVGLESDGYCRALESGQHEYTWPEEHKEIEETHSGTMSVKVNTTLRWVSENAYIMARDLITADCSTLYLCKRESDRFFKCRAITPYVEGRKNLSYVISPDNSNVAFISCKDNHQYGLYVTNVGPIEQDPVSTAGEQGPQLIEIDEDPLYDLELDDTIDLLKQGKLICWSDGELQQQEREIENYLKTPECLYQIQENVKRYTNIDD